MTFVGKLVFGTGGRFGRLSPSECSRLVSEAYDLGIRAFDTGSQYCSGLSQELLINSFKLASFDRSSFHFSTKVRMFSDADPLHLERTVDSILISNPYISYIDTLFLWGPSFLELTCIDAIDSSLQRLLSSGKVKSIGLNTHDLPVMKYSLTSHHFDSLLIDFNLLQLDRMSLVSYMPRSDKLQLWAGTSLAQGFLVQSLFSMYFRTRSLSYLARALFQRSTSRFLRPAKLCREHLACTYPKLCRQIPLYYVLSRSFVSRVPIGMLSSASIRRNVDISNLCLSEAILDDVCEWSSRFCQVSTKI